MQLPIILRMQVLGRTGVSKCRRFVFVACTIALLATIAHFGVAIWAKSEFTQPEGIVATQVRSLAEEGALYYDLKQYPYTVCAYMPLLYGTVAAMYKAGVPLLLGARLISIFAVLAILYLVWKILKLYTGESLYAWTGFALAGITQLLLGWGTAGRADVPAVALSLSAFYLYARYSLLGEECLDKAAILAILGLLFKQTAIAAPAAIFLLLALPSPKRALRFGLIVGGIGGAIVLGFNALLDGRFLFNTVSSNLNPFALFKLQLHIEYMVAMLSPLILVAAVGAKKTIATRGKEAYVYLLAAFSLLVATACKLGSDYNYQIETAILLIVCTCLSMHSLNFFELYSMGSKSWITMLILPLAVFAVQNVRSSTTSLFERIEGEQKFRVQLKELEPIFARPGPVLSADSNSLVHFNSRIEVEPLIYRLLVEAGKVDASPVIQDIERAKFQTILLFENIAEKPNLDPEYPRLPSDHMAAIRKNYRLTKRIPGPLANGLYIYQPFREQTK